MRSPVLLLALLAVPALADEPCAPVKPCEIQDQGGPQAREDPADYAGQARQIFDLLSCRGPVPAGLDPAPVRAFCARQAKLLSRSGQARAALRAVIDPLRPARLPSAVVDPLSDSDLLRALAAYPDARNITLFSDRGCGDPRLLASMREPGRLAAFLSSVEDDIDDLLRGANGEPRRPVRSRPWRIGLPLMIWGLIADDDEPVGLKLVRIEPAGTLRYLGPGEIASQEKEAAREQGSAGPYESCELAFVRRGDPAGTAPRLVRNLRADLSDAGLAAHPGPLAHLESKGRFAALLLDARGLGGEGLSRLRKIVLERAAFVVSDGTGPTAEQLRQAGLSQESHPRPGGGPAVVVIRRP
jgi:hypothetical protein